MNFTMSAEFATDHARNLWSEGQFRKAIDWVYLFGLDVEQGYGLISGKYKLVETDKENNFDLEDDDWKPNLSMCHLCRYPDPTRMGDIDAEFQEAHQFW